MKKLLLLFIAAAFFAGPLAADSYIYSSLVPKTAKSMAMGGVFTSVPTAEFSFFGNPAAFAAKKATFAFPSIDVWGYVRPTISNIQALASSAGDTSSLMSTAFGLMSQNGGTGGGLSLGGGFAGKGLGIGVFATTDEGIYGSSPASASVTSETEFTGVIGLGAPLQLGALRISVGGDLRPFYRVSLYEAGGSDIALADLLSWSQDGTDMGDMLYAGSFFGAAVDLGATIELGALTVGMSIRDIAPNYNITWTTLNQLASGDSSSGAASEDKAVFLPDISAGLSWKPEISSLIEPALYLELKDPINVFTNYEGIGSALNLFHAGAEVRLLKFIYLRGGINRGWLSAGAGIKLLCFDVNAAVFTEELGALAGDDPRSGFTLQAAIRF
jgi:hypothetical protein